MTKKNFKRNFQQVYSNYHSGPEGHSINFSFCQFLGFRGKFYGYKDILMGYLGFKNPYETKKLSLKVWDSNP